MSSCDHTFLLFFLYFCCDAQKGSCIHPSICPLPIHLKDNSNTNNSSPKISCHSLMFTHLDTLKCFIPPFASLFLHLFYAFLSTMPACLSLSFPCAPSLSLSCFPLISPPQVLFPSHLCVWLLSCSLNVAAASLLLPPQASSAKLGAAALLWCSMHF